MRSLLQCCRYSGCCGPSACFFYRSTKKKPERKVDASGMVPAPTSCANGTHGHRWSRPRPRQCRAQHGEAPMDLGPGFGRSNMAMAGARASRSGLCINLALSSTFNFLAGSQGARERPLWLPNTNQQVWDCPLATMFRAMTPPTSRLGPKRKQSSAFLVKLRGFWCPLYKEASSAAAGPQKGPSF